MKISLRVFAAALSLVLLPVDAIPALASTDEACQFGQTSTDDGEGNITCSTSYWKVSSSSDGFDKILIAKIEEDLAGLPGDTKITNATLVIRCTARKLETYVAMSDVQFDQDTQSYSTSFQYRADSGKVYRSTLGTSTDGTGFFILNPKTFLTNIAKAKVKISFKFGGSNGNRVTQFPVSNMSSFRTKFKANGCSY